MKLRTWNKYTKSDESKTSISCGIVSWLIWGQRVVVAQMRGWQYVECWREHDCYWLSGRRTIKNSRLSCIASIYTFAYTYVYGETRSDGGGGTIGTRVPLSGRPLVRGERTCARLLTLPANWTSLSLRRAYYQLLANLLHLLLFTYTKLPINYIWNHIWNHLCHIWDHI